MTSYSPEPRDLSPPAVSGGQSRQQHTATTQSVLPADLHPSGSRSGVDHGGQRQRPIHRPFEDQEVHECDIDDNSGRHVVNAAKSSGSRPDPADFSETTHCGSSSSGPSTAIQVQPNLVAAEHQLFLQQQQRLQAVRCGRQPQGGELAITSSLTAPPFYYHQHAVSAAAAQAAAASVAAAAQQHIQQMMFQQQQQKKMTSDMPEMASMLSIFGGGGGGNNRMLYNDQMKSMLLHRIIDENNASSRHVEEAADRNRLSGHCLTSSGCDVISDEDDDRLLDVLDDSDGDEVNSLASMSPLRRERGGRIDQRQQQMHHSHMMMCRITPGSNGGSGPTAAAAAAAGDSRQIDNQNDILMATSQQKLAMSPQQFQKAPAG